MTTKLSASEKIIFVSVGFTIVLLAFRIFYSETLSYIFYAWNLLLASIPILFSRQLQKHQRFTTKTFLLMAGWLLFLPNSPYVVTDIIHFRERWPVPKWYDLLIVTSAAWNGLCLGFISLMQVEQFLSRYMSKLKVQLLVSAFIFLCGYGIYIGRFLRFNSWDIVSSPGALASETMQHVLYPVDNFRVWEFTFLFSLMLAISYTTLKHLPIRENPAMNP
jgi:uncharacterized membrane protein